MVFVVSVQVLEFNMVSINQDSVLRVVPQMDYFKTTPFWKRPSIPQKPVCVGLGCALQHERVPVRRKDGDENNKLLK